MISTHTHKPASLPDNRGLQYDEALLIERSMPGRSGVDLPALQNITLRTGQPERNNIGLPSLGEQQVIRHFVRLSQMNFSIDTGFYPLGSCTMKHNPRLNEKMARLQKLSNLHPLQDESTIQGSLEIMHQLQHWLATLTGLPGVSLCPAAGAHGELAGMMVILKAHEARGDKRNIVLVPDSAHGTNPATAAMCGYTIQSVPTTNEGFVDLEALRAALNSDVAAFMLTNPSTVGLFDPRVKEISELLHAAGAYFYCDGANFNAIAGRIRPADFGVDVMHINLHKTFSTPHGGGGPGSGPIVVSKDLEPYLPVPRVVQKPDKSFSLITEDQYAIGRMKAFHGHFGMFIRALSYMLAHGGNGIKQASEDAVLNANYILAQLKDTYHTPFSGPCMHECLLSDKNQRPSGIDTMDIAKTLIEHGIHPMTVFFPLVVKGAMLIEPTESETKETLDHFITLMRYIAHEAAQGNTKIFKQNPISTPRKRVDEVLAVKQLKLVW
jgi:glycine dehydrogenase subunit 2